MLNGELTPNHPLQRTNEEARKNCIIVKASGVVHNNMCHSLLAPRYCTAGVRYRLVVPNEEAATAISPRQNQTVHQPPIRAVNTNATKTTESSSSNLLPTRNASVAVIFAGDARTLLCPTACKAFNQAILQPLMDANFSVHIFALIKPTVYYGANSPWVGKHPQCADYDTPFVNVSKSFVPGAPIEDAVALLSANSQELRVMDNATAAASWDMTLEQKAESIGCADMLQDIGPNTNTSTRLIHSGYTHFSQWKTVHDGYIMMEEAEIQASERFEYVMRLRPDCLPTMASILDEQNRLPLSTSDHAAITHYGDGFSIMARESSDAYFNVYQTYGHFCDTNKKLNSGQYAWSENTDHYFSKFINGEKGVQLVSHNNFTFWFRRPFTCTQLCEEKLLGFL